MPLNLEFSKTGKISAEQQLSFYLRVANNRTDTTTGALGLKHGATLFYSSGLQKPYFAFQNFIFCSSIKSDPNDDIMIPAQSISSVPGRLTQGGSFKVVMKNNLSFS